MTDSDASGRRTIQIEVPEKFLENDETYVQVTFDPHQIKHFEEWVMVSGFSGDVWMYLNTETGEIEEEIHV